MFDLANKIPARLEKKRVEIQQKIFFLLEARRMWLLRIFILTTLLISPEKAVAVRSCRYLQRNNGWFDHVWNTYSETRLKKTLHVSKATFTFILSRIEHDLQRDTVAEDPIPFFLELQFSAKDFLLISDTSPLASSWSLLSTSLLVGYRYQLRFLRSMIFPHQALKQLKWC